jgi:branched-subunit amino acid aminotransferase/4-amino-4-deoxychorismate lyase
MTPADRNILKGRTRKTVMTLAKKLNIPVAETDLQPWHLYNCDEAFLCSTYPGPLQPISRFNGVPVGKGVPHTITGKLTEAWSEWVGMDITGRNRLNEDDKAMLEKERAVMDGERAALTHITF